MNVHTYETSGGKDLIREYLSKLPIRERTDAYSVIENFEKGELDKIDFKRWRGDIFEAYFYRHKRMFYVSVDKKDVYILHACKKQKNKTESKDGNIAVKRAKELGKKLSKKFI